MAIRAALIALASAARGFVAPAPLRARHPLRLPSPLCCDAALDVELAAALDAALAAAERGVGADALSPELAPKRTVVLVGGRAITLRVPEDDAVFERMSASARAAALATGSVDAYAEALEDLVATAPPAYWAQLWPSALALARRLLEEPELVAGRTVLDVGSGLGLTAVAASLAGASAVLATDREPDALRYVEANALENGASLEVAKLDWGSIDWGRAGTAAPFDAPFGAAVCSDVLYDEESPRVLAALLTACVAPGGLVLVADSTGRPYGSRRRDELRARLCGNGGAFELVAPPVRRMIELSFGHAELRARQGDTFEVEMCELRRSPDEPGND